MAYTPGADYSYWQAQNNFDKAKAEGLRFAIFRAGFNTAIDPRFVENVQNAKDKLIRGAYWFYDWRPTGATVEKQGAAFKSMLASSPIEINVPAMDFENPYAGFSPTAFPNRLNALQIMQRFKDAVGAKRMMLYINSSTLKTLRPFPTWLLEEWDLWIAAWPLNKSPMYYTDIPSDWQPDTYGWKWTFWQYTAKMDGKRFGAGSLDLDGDIFNGDEDALRVYANMTTTPPPPPDPDPECPDTSAVIDELEDAQLGIEEGLNLIRAAQARIDQARRLLE